MTEFVPLGFVALRYNENRYRPLMVLCRAPADDGWLAIESSTGIIFNLFDSIAHLYAAVVAGGTNNSANDFSSRARQADLLARATWYHTPAGMETVGAPPKRRRAAA